MVSDAASRYSHALSKLDGSLKRNLGIQRRFTPCPSSESDTVDAVLKARSNSCVEEIHEQSACTFLLLVLDTINIVLWDVLVLLRQPIVNIIADVPLHCDLLSPTRSLGNTTAGGKLLAQFFRNLLQI